MRQGTRGEEREITDYSMALVVDILCEKDLAVLALADLDLEAVLVDHLDVQARGRATPDAFVGHDYGLVGVVLVDGVEGMETGPGLGGPVAGRGCDGVGHV